MTADDSDTTEVVSEQELQAAFRNTNFGTPHHRQLLHVAVLKKACGYHCGHTITCIMQKLGLIGVRGAPTRKGQRLMQIAFHQIMAAGFFSPVEERVAFISGLRHGEAAHGITGAPNGKPT